MSKKGIHYPRGNGIDKSVRVMTNGDREGRIFHRVMTNGDREGQILHRVMKNGGREGRIFLSHSY